MRPVFESAEENDNNELTVFVNTKDQLYVEINDGSNDIMESKCICLSKEEATLFHKEIGKLLKTF